MNYTPQYNALGLKQYLETNPNSKLDFIDAILLNEINSIITNWHNINTKTKNNNVFYNISYCKLRDQIPHLPFGNNKNNSLVKRPNEGISKRLKRGLIKECLIELFVDRIDNSKIYFRLTPKGYQFINTRIDVREPIGLASVSLSDRYPTNKNINNKNINNKRELSHFEFLNNNFKDEIIRIKKYYSLNENDWRLCTGKFNEKPIKKITVNSFETFVNNWKNNLPKKNIDLSDQTNKYLGNAI